MSTQAVQFDGATYEPERDESRLTLQFAAVRDLMQDGEWRTLQTIAVLVGAPPASVSARLRDLRKVRFGSWHVERRYDGNGLYSYRLNGQSAQAVREDKTDRSVLVAQNAALKFEVKQLRELLELRSLSFAQKKFRQTPVRRELQTSFL